MCVCVCACCCEFLTCSSVCSNEEREIEGKRKERGKGTAEECSKYKKNIDLSFSLHISLFMNCYSSLFETQMLLHLLKYSSYLLLI